MFPTAFTHNITQFARTLSLPERFQHSPFRNLSLEHLRRRNTALDALFYDIKCVTAEEAFYISSCLAAEGAILIVPPTGAEPLRLCDTVDDFFQAGGAKIETLAIAGVGSSALGSAALGRNIADATGTPVAVVISGYGLADAVTEVMGGNFLFGYMNSVRHAFEQLDEFFGRPQFGVATRLSSEKLSEVSLDTHTLRALLLDPRLSLKLLVGHSKGNLVLSEALSGIAESDEGRAQQLADTLKIVTFSARIAMPPVFRDVVDVMGEWDWYGELNSRRSIETDQVVAQALHHTNTELPNHIPVTKVLKEILAKTSAPATEIPELLVQEPVAVAIETPFLADTVAEAEAETVAVEETVEALEIEPVPAEVTEAVVTEEVPPAAIAVEPDDTKEVLLGTTAVIPAPEQEEEAADPKPSSSLLPFKAKRGVRRTKRS